MTRARRASIGAVPQRRVGDRSVQRNARFVLTVASVTEDLIWEFSKGPVAQVRKTPDRRIWCGPPTSPSSFVATAFGGHSWRRAPSGSRYLSVGATFLNGTLPAEDDRAAGTLRGVCRLLMTARGRSHGAPAQAYEVFEGRPDAWPE